MIEWQWCRLDELRPAQLYAICAAREAVFVVEQGCAYQELDGLDLEAEHLIAWSGKAVAAYLRLLPPGVKCSEPVLGRIMTGKPFRGKGLGCQLLERALTRTGMRYPGQGVRISAQSHLQGFYRKFGFEAVSASYLEDGIPHVEMRWSVTAIPPSPDSSV